MKHWMPHIHFGSSSSECLEDEAEGGREGWYFELCWFGCMLSIQWFSVYAHRRFMARILGERP